jgi:hypothetical protein
MPTYNYSISPTERDLLTLYFIHLLNSCSIDHIAALLYNGSLSACYQRLALLSEREDEPEARLISWKRLGSSSGVGSGKALLSLTNKGREVLAIEYLHVPTSAIKPSKQISTSYGRDQHLALCDFWVELYLAVDNYSKKHKFLFMEFESERFLRSNPIVVTKSRRPVRRIKSFISDGNLLMRISPVDKQAFILEIESDPLRRPAIIKDKLAGYFDHLSSLILNCATSETGPKPDIPFILWVVPDSKAAAVMDAWVLELAQRFGDDPSFFWIAAKDQISRQRILAPIWKAVGVDRHQSLLPASHLQLLQPPLDSLPYHPAQAYERLNQYLTI